MYACMHVCMYVCLYEHVVYVCIGMMYTYMYSLCILHMHAFRQAIDKLEYLVKAVPMWTFYKATT